MQITFTAPATFFSRRILIGEAGQEVGLAVTDGKVTTAELVADMLMAKGFTPDDQAFVFDLQAAFDRADDGDKRTWLMAHGIFDFVGTLPQNLEGDQRIAAEAARVDGLRAMAQKMLAARLAVQPPG